MMMIMIIWNGIVDSNLPFMRHCLAESCSAKCQFAKCCCAVFKDSLKEMSKWCHDTQHNDTQYNDTQYNDTQHNDTQHLNSQRNGPQHNGT